MKKSTPSAICAADIPLFDGLAFCAIGTDFKRAEKGFANLVMNDLRHNSHSAETLWQIFSDFKTTAQDFLNQGAGDGCTIYTKTDASVPFIFLPEYSTPVLVHEISHATERIMSTWGFKDGELRAYITEYLFKRFVM